MADAFESHQPGLTSPAIDAFAITPDDDEDLEQVARSIYVGSTGNIRVTTAKGSVVTFTGLPAGGILPVRVSRVHATSTTAGGLIGLV